MSLRSFGYFLIVSVVVFKVPVMVVPDLITVKRSDFEVVPCANVSVSVMFGVHSTQLTVTASAFTLTVPGMVFFIFTTYLPLERLVKLNIPLAFVSVVATVCWVNADSKITVRFATGELFTAISGLVEGGGVFCA
jgi:hypothetical protein